MFDQFWTEKTINRWTVVQLIAIKCFNLLTALFIIFHIADIPPNVKKYEFLLWKVLNQTCHFPPLSFHLQDNFPPINSFLAADFFLSLQAAHVNPHNKGLTFQLHFTVRGWTYIYEYQFKWEIKFQITD